MLSWYQSRGLETLRLEPCRPCRRCTCHRWPQTCHRKGGGGCRGTHGGDGGGDSRGGGSDGGSGSGSGGGGTVKN